jgi:hypothetical protein
VECRSAWERASERAGRQAGGRVGCGHRGVEIGDEVCTIWERLLLLFLYFFARELGVAASFCIITGCEAPGSSSESSSDKTLRPREVVVTMSRHALRP